jgi:hypothetical protein
VVNVQHELRGPWTVFFDTTLGGPGDTILFNQLSDWTENEDSSIKYYSGRARYYNSYIRDSAAHKSPGPVWLNLGKVNNLAEVFVNGVSCGVAWTWPYRVDISKALKNGANVIRIDVVNTWNNRMVGDGRLSPERRIFKTVYPFKMENRPLLPAGLLGPVTVIEQR